MVKTISLTLNNDQPDPSRIGRIDNNLLAEGILGYAEGIA
jgi:hypothetical protein